MALEQSGWQACQECPLRLTLNGFARLRQLSVPNDPAKAARRQVSLAASGNLTDHTSQSHLTVSSPPVLAGQREANRH